MSAFPQSGNGPSLAPVIRLFFHCLLLAGLGGCATHNATSTLRPGDPAAPSQVTPSEAIHTARLFCEMPWQPFHRNVLHGPDARGIRVDTPDAAYRPANGRHGWWIPGEINRGMPYKWGGFDDAESFQRGIAAGLAAGDVSTPSKRRADNAAVSKYAAGVDCSGLISRCLGLPRHHDSSQLPDVCDVLPGYGDLRPGDLLNIPREHVMLVAGWADAARTQICYYETGGIPDWKPALKVSPAQKLIALGFQPLRYRGMAREPLPSGKEVLTRSAVASAVPVPEPQAWWRE